MKKPSLIILALLGVLIVSAGIALAWHQTAVAPSPSTSPTPTPQAEAQTYTGTTVCLPHKNTSGPQTLECALGMQTADGKYYGLRATTDNQGKFTPKMNQPLSIRGTLAAPTDSDTYNVAGNLTIVEVLPTTP